MRPNKPINSGADRAEPRVTGKGRFNTTAAQPRHDEQPHQPADPTRAANDGHHAVSKYSGRATVRAMVDEELDAAIELAHAEWVDPLDEHPFDLSSVTIDLRESQHPNPPATYYERLGSKVPGRG